MKNLPRLLMQIPLAEKRLHAQVAILKQIRRTADDLRGVLSPKRAQRLLPDTTCLEDKIVREITRLLALKAQAQDVIAQLEDDRERLILELRYLKLMKWEDVALEANYALRSVMRLHRQAMGKLREMNPTDGEAAEFAGQVNQLTGVDVDPSLL